MPDLRGRCANLEHCFVAVSQRIIVLPDGARFACPSCGEPLQPIHQTRQTWMPSVLGLILQFTVTIPAGVWVGYKLAGHDFPDIRAYWTEITHRPSVQSTLPPILPARVPSPPQQAPTVATPGYEQLRDALHDALASQKAQNEGARQEKQDEGRK